MSLEGQQLGEFEILERLGQGGMGAVYKARQTKLRRLVALKTLQSSLADDAEYIARFEQEAIAAAGLNHPNLVQVHSAGENDGLYWFAMEYVEGESAKGRLKRKGRIEPVEAIAIAIHVATALEYGWRKAQLIHRDIKPDNIFLSEDGEVKLGDLGLAKSAGQTQGLTVTGHSMGTPHYISPEQVEAMKAVDLRADIYSLGCTLYHMLSGRVPFDGNSAVSIMMKHVNGPVPHLNDAWPQCPQVLNDVVGKMMQKDPALRQQDYGEVIGDLRQAYDVVSNEEGVTPTPKANGTTPKTHAPVTVQPASGKKSKVPPYAGIGGLVLLIAVVFFFIFKPKEQAVTGTQAAMASNTSGSSTTPATATKDQPFVNTLGMKFVPVPGTKVLFSIWDTRVQDYAAYAVANPKADGNWKTQEKDGVPVSRETDYPVVGVNWEDAQAFCQWLTEKEIAEGKLPNGLKYRLPTDEEWSWAAGMPPELGTTPAEKSQRYSADFPWGKDYPPAKKMGNYADETFHAKFLPNENAKDDWNKNNHWIEGYNDGYATTSPVESFPANAYGLCDIGGNVWQWCEDWFDASHKDRVLRGAAWDDYERANLLSKNRHHNAPTHRFNNYGFRCVLEIENKTTKTASTPDKATKDLPFVNSLGMKFVPVPETKVLFSIWDTRVQDYKAHVAVNKVDDSWTKQEKDGVPVSRETDYPVVGVNWEDAQAFCQWLTEKEIAEGKLPNGLKYRLPTDEEWSWAAGMPPELGTTPAEKSQEYSANFPWGKDYPPTKKVGNYADETFHAKFLPNENAKDEWNKNQWIAGYTDGYATTSPVGSFPANAYGLYDMGGNVWQWCEDWFDASHKDRVLRGAAWRNYERSGLHSSYRYRYAPAGRLDDRGFRCVMELPQK